MGIFVFPFVQAHGPRFVQAIFAGVGDYFLYLLADRLIGRRGAFWTVTQHNSHSIAYDEPHRRGTNMKC